MRLWAKLIDSSDFVEKRTHTERDRTIRFRMLDASLFFFFFCIGCSILHGDKSLFPIKVKIAYKLLANELGSHGRSVENASEIFRNPIHTCAFAMRVNS